MIRRFRNYLFLIFTLSLAACASPLVVDTSESVIKPAGTYRSTVSSYEIVNGSPAMQREIALFGDSYVPLVLAKPTSETVEEDLRRLFDATISRAPTSEYSFRVLIKRAHSHWTWSTAQKLPFVGLALVSAPVDYTLDLAILFEVEQNGRVLRTFPYERKVVIQNSAAVESSQIEGYQRLIAEYRATALREIERELIGRYLPAPTP